jgi:hypothetical protein
MILLIVFAIRLILDFPADHQAPIYKEHHGRILASGYLFDHWLKSLSFDAFVLIGISHTVREPLILAPAEVHKAVLHAVRSISHVDFLDEDLPFLELLKVHRPLAHLVVVEEYGVVVNLVLDFFQIGEADAIRIGDGSDSDQAF